MTEIEFSISTVESGIASFTTSKIKGKLKAIIIDSKEDMKINVTAGNFLLLDLAQFKGNEYFAVRRYAVNEKAEMINYSTVEWIINDKVNVII